MAGNFQKSEKVARVAVGLSGGVDSAVSAALLAEQGYRVTGVFLECWRAPGCRTDEDRKDALAVALKLEIPFKVLDFKREYYERVVEYFFREYEAGRTPNPDTMCNREIKFGMFYVWAMESGFDFVATGHYARVLETREFSIFNFQFSNKSHLEKVQKHCLVRGVDTKKDQSYFLYQLQPEQLGHILFPIGHLTKSQVREEARTRRLPVAEKPDSQGICFIGPVDVRSFLGERIDKKVGEVVYKLPAEILKQVADDNWVEGGKQIQDDRPRDDKVVVVGEHEGAAFYTIGQRLGKELDQKTIVELAKKGLVDVDPTKMPGLFVVRKEMAKNRLYVGLERDLEVREFEVEDLNWLVEGEILKQVADDGGKEVFVRIRHGGELVRARLIKQGSEPCLGVRTEEPLRGVASGQACVIYGDDSMEGVVWGGGVIR